MKFERWDNGRGEVQRNDVFRSLMMPSKIKSLTREMNQCKGKILLQIQKDIISQVHLFPDEYIDRIF